MPDDGFNVTDAWEFMAHSVMGETPTSVALEALDAAVARVREHNETREIRPAFAALTEGTWWVAAIDERLLKGLGGVKSDAARLYREERDRDENGEYVLGFLWARDRHTHQLPVSMDRDNTPFFGGGGGVLHISPGFRWRPSADLYEPEESRSPAGSRAAYDRLLAGQSAWKTLNRCARWFHRMAGHAEFP